MLYSYTAVFPYWSDKNKLVHLVGEEREISGPKFVSLEEAKHSSRVLYTDSIVRGERRHGRCFMMVRPFSQETALAVLAQLNNCAPSQIVIKGWD